MASRTEQAATPTGAGNGLWNMVDSSDSQPCPGRQQPGVTTTSPVMPISSCGTQTYLYRPGVVNACSNAPPGFTLPESNGSAPAGRATSLASDACFGSAVTV